jgi:hypothetical protein
MRKHLWLVVLPFSLYCFGVFLNTLVMSANGSMPVVLPVAELGSHQPGDLLDAAHTAYSADVHLRTLCDWIVIPGIGTASIGDLFLWLGDYLQFPGLIAYFTLIFFGDHEPRH